MFAYADGYVSNVRLAHAFPLGQILPPLFTLPSFFHANNAAFTSWAGFPAPKFTALVIVTSAKMEQ
jgi:hypothetical protein